MVWHWGELLMTGRSRFIAAIAAGALLLAGCVPEPAPQRPPRVDNPAALSNDDLARFLPALADYPSPSWDITSRVGPATSRYLFGPRIDLDTPTDPPQCQDIPFERPGQIAAAVDGSVPNGIAGDSGEASIRILREPEGTDLIAQTLDWAKRCHDFHQNYPGVTPQDPPVSNPTAVSVLPATHIDGQPVTRLHFTDNRAQRFQPEGSRESMVTLARVRGLVVMGFRHDNTVDADAIFSATLKRLTAGTPASKPLSANPEQSALSDRSDKEIEQLLPATTDLPEGGWTVQQSTPIIRDGSEESPSRTDPSGCDRIPFRSNSWRPDLDRAFRQITSVTAWREDKQRTVSDTVAIGVDNPGASLLTETAEWVRKCGAYRSLGPHSTRYTLSLTEEQSHGYPATTITIASDAPYRAHETISMMKVRDLLVITTPGDSELRSPLLQHVIDNLSHAEYSSAATGSGPIPRPQDPQKRPAGDVAIPAPTEDSTTQFTKVAQGRLVDPEQYRPGGYLPGDTPTTNPDYLHFRSPTGSIICSWRKFVLYCDVPQGTYPRTPKPAEIASGWTDSSVRFGFNGIQNGVAAADPFIYAESQVLRYGSTIRLEQTPGQTECRMDLEGLTCVDFMKRVGMHLSRGDLTPFAGGESIQPDQRATPN